MSNLTSSFVILFSCCFCCILVGLGLAFGIWAIVDSIPPTCCEELIIPNSGNITIKSGYYLDILDSDTDQLLGHIKRRSLVWSRTVDFMGPNKKAALVAYWAFWRFGDDVRLYNANDTETAIARLKKQLMTFYSKYYLYNSNETHIATLQSHAITTNNYTVHHPENPSLIYARLTAPLIAIPMKWTIKVDMEASMNAGIDPRIYPFMVGVLRFSDSNED